MQRQHDDFARCVAREGDAAGAGGHADDERHAGEGALETAGQLEHAERDVIVLPQHDVVFEKHRIIRAQVNFRHRDDLAFHLARAGAELKLGHVAQARSFAPARFADQIANIERRPAGAASERGFLVLALAPLALNAFEWLGYWDRFRHSSCSPDVDKFR